LRRTSGERYKWWRYLLELKAALIALKTAHPPKITQALTGGCYN
jgi:hypothetical protein